MPIALGPLPPTTLAFTGIGELPVSGISVLISLEPESGVTWSLINDVQFSWGQCLQFLAQA